ncbi:MAG: glycoside hydrolase family 2 [Tannerella sp.]|jgi:hypothetical protein|nr:glycoside hydrolase family 2 [Tannerella sp.]
MKNCLNIILLLVLTVHFRLDGQVVNYERASDRVWLDSKEWHHGAYEWKMMKVSDLQDSGEKISQTGFDAGKWLPAIVPGTVLNSLVYNKIYPEPYFGLNNKLESGLIPDISTVGRDFYTYWFRTEFEIPASFGDKNIWIQPEGVNYRAEVWINGHLLGFINGMFFRDYINITEFAKPGGQNVIALKVYPVDEPGTTQPKIWGAKGEFRNGGNGNIGLNTTMLMSVGWDFTFMDGIRDRNTGIWKSIALYATGKLALRHPFIRSELDKPGYDRSNETVSVEIVNPSATMDTVRCTVSGEITGENIKFSKSVALLRGEEKLVSFTSEDFPQLKMEKPRLWFPVNKGEPNLYELKLQVSVEGIVCDSVKTRFGIREITSDTNTPDGSRMFYINGRRLFIRGTNWTPEAMLRNSDERTYAELRYTRQSGINMIRIWGGGIAESDCFFQLCDELGILVWQEFWLTGDTRHPHDRGVYLSNVESTVKRIRNHPSLAYYVSSNESTEVSGASQLIENLDGTRGYQMQSECDGVHDGSPYKQVNPMQHYENTASERGSRVDGFNPEYGAPTLPTVECLREMMDEKDLWPINREVWDYLDGNGFHLMATMYKDLVNNYGESSSIDEFAQKGQFIGAINSKSIWEVWNYNKLDYGDRFASGLLFWYHNSPVRQVSSNMWDWSLEPTASLYYTANSLQPLHPQFDYLKNTVSVVNDYYKSFDNYAVTATVYDIDSRKTWSKSAKIDIPEDGVVNDVFKIEFPGDISRVHFMKLILKDENGKEVSSNFYWRSTDEYGGKKTLTGPAVSGFEDLAKLKRAQLNVSCKIREEGTLFFVDITLKNKSSNIAFFNQIQLLDNKSFPVRPSFFTDNFFSLLPGESRSVTIETAVKNLNGTDARLVVKGWNIESKVFHLDR